MGQTAFYTAADASAIATAGVAVTVFQADTVNSGCDIVNTGAMTLYVDFVGVAAAGSGTSIPVAAGATYRCPYPPSGAVTAVAAVAQAFVAVRY